MKSSYKRNLLLGFGLSLLLLLISSIASYLSIRNLLDSMGWVTHTNEVIEKLNFVSAGLKDAESGTRGYMLTNNKEFIVSLQNTSTAVSQAINDIEKLTLDNPDQKTRIPELRQAVTTRIDFLERIVQSNDPSKTISRETLMEGKKVMENVTALLNAMKKGEQDLLKTRTTRMETFSNFSPVLIIITLIVSLIITIAFYSRVNSDFSEKNKLQESLLAKDVEITNRINIIQGIADKVASGDYSVRVNDDQRDSLGGVASSLNKMAGSLQYSFKELSDKEWLQTGLAKLNEVIIGEKSVQTLSSHIVEFMAGYSQSQTGAVYIVDGENLHFSAGYAYIAPKEREQFKLGEGLVGQSVATGLLMELKEVPADSITITFTAGSAKPSHIVAVPVYDGYNIKGAIELGSLTPYNSLHIEFIKQCSKVIGTAMSMSQNRKRMQELLEETQSQSEELQSQHNELENMNSELEAQTEKLQASEEELKVQQEELRHKQELEERSLMLENRNELIVQRNLEIQTKAEALAQSTRYKSEFLANMSHELRTPLNSILLLSRLMTENSEKNLTPDQVEYARVIQSSGTGLLSLIDEILDLSKIESGKMELDYSSITIDEIVNDMKSLFSPVAKEKNIEFKTIVAADVPAKIETDKLRLEQIIRNLLSNALKFTSKGYVSLDISRSPDNNFMLRFKVKDTGIGIAAEKRDLIFEAFQQADGSTRRKYGGTGLGLSISRELAKLLGGEIVMDSEVEVGSEFTVIVPISKPKQGSAKPESTPVYASVHATRTSKNPDKYISTTIPENIPDDRGDLSADTKTLLIIEDDTAFARILLEYTRSRGYKGIVAVRGDEGIQLAKDLLPTAILLDIQLPVMSGWDVMDELKKNAGTRHIPVHIMSSFDGEKNESLRMGAIDFINKPVSADQIQDVFKKIEYVLSHDPKKVLIIEENPKHAKALAYFLETFQITQEIRNSIPEAIVALQQDDVNCVILDMGLPDQASYDELEKVRKTPGLENTPVIIFTGKTLSREEESRIRKYANSIVVKTAHSYKRVLDEVSLFLHLVEKKDGSEPQKPYYSKLGDLDEVLMNKTVLIADDDVRNIFSLSKAMEKYKMKVITAIDGKDAMKQLAANTQIDIVLMDMMMPEMDGYETTTKIRNDRRFKDLPVIAVTAKAMAGDRAKCIAAGASDYISKPVDIDQLLSLLRVWLYEKGI